MEIIHIVLGKANPDRLNGVNKVVFHLATEQSKAGKKVQVWGVTPNPVHDYPERNFKTLLFKAESFPFAVNAALKKAILSNRNAVFHLHGGWIPLFSSLSGILAKNHIKYVLTPHGAYNEVAMKRSSFQKKNYFHLFEKSLLQRVHKVHAIGKSEVEGLNHIFPHAHSFLLPYGFDLNTDSIKTLKNKDFTIGFVGRLDTHTKGLDLLMEAYAIFHKKYPDSKLWIIGEGEGQAYLENFITEKQLKNVVLWGKKFGTEKDALIGKMHVFAHPSRNEGLPTAVLEAAALGTPTIVTYATNLAEYVSEFKAGIGIENESINALEKSMEVIYNAYQSGQMDTYIQGAKEMLENVFAWPVLVEKFDELYR
ncbi:glycosyltransferase family 4 protein [Cognataquiflexum rubidum]|uniref:glycosyltransferase family 4 protein n=1 Tax=Cognataquiflexum rubidum TaxID=2922273 RepID=UPI001F142439|nr:glycosyltransferase family 4 protein [Cognataquiflexum rubidum]MCH6234482.1 glycosyltransferase family 4 protein [Cognataquiflexum rubidum]